ncbi:MAG TPA: flagellar hook-basal body complex protein [Gemmataceae bacterium]|nr:flagellar hook-basal body complex protein [Gemmataceae bacterium]
MANSLLTGVSGLRVHQEMLNVVGNNLANLNTTGFKSQRTEFADLLYETLSQATSSTSQKVGGTNPLQVGLGVKLASIDQNLQQGSLEATNGDFDLAIEGNGFFVVNNGVQDLYTRAGAFAVDEKNHLVDPATGFSVQRFGSVGEGTATSPAFQTPGDNTINIPFGIGIPGQVTSTVKLQGNLDAAAVGPLAQTLTSATPFKSGGVAATLATRLDALDDNTVDYPAGGTDQIRLQGTTVGGTAVNVTIPVDDTTTLQTLVNAINANFAGTTASLDASGNLVMQANATGPAAFTLQISDAAGNVGSTNWSNHSLLVTTAGKNGDTATTAIQVYDAQGTAHNVTFTFQKVANNVWNLSGSILPSEGTVVDGSVQGITFNDNGSFQGVTGSGTGDAFMTFHFNGLSQPQTIGFSFGTPQAFDGLTQFGGSSSASAVSQNGFAAGFLTSVSVSKGGVINGIFTNGRTLPLAQLAIASFANPAGLNREGDNYFGVSTHSGDALIGAGLTGGRGQIQQGTLESSNVDVAQEFTRLIIAQRGFEVNARTITTSDQVLQALTNIIR